MKHLARIVFYLFLFVVSSVSYGQMVEYSYSREIQNISDPWHKIILPNEVFAKTLQDLSDIRVFGLNNIGDTIEAPYLLQLSKEKVSNRDVAFQILNVSHKGNGYYFTFEIPTIESINQMKLDFAQENFDWKVSLEGSQDRDEWFTVLEDYRILSIKNDLADYQFTKLDFPSAKYRFFRLFVQSSEQPQLKVASISKYDITDGIYRTYRIQQLSISENKQTKQTVIDVTMDSPVRVSHVDIGILDTFDYYRHVTIQYLTDSLKTDYGWKNNFRTLTTGIVNSLEKNVFHFSSTTIQKLKIYIDNYDNQALEIDHIRVKGYQHELVIRFADQASYHLTYGNKKASRPKYDIGRFTANIPQTLTALDLGDEVMMQKHESPEVEPLFKNKIWLWAIMIVIILSLGWFSVKMIRNN